MMEFYPHIKLVHVCAAIATTAVFTLRGLCMIRGWSIYNAAPVRYLSYAIDTTLLTAALMLATILPEGFFANGWLWVKIALLVVYIVLGTIALKRGRTRAVRILAFGAAVVTLILIFETARAHHPLGLLLRLT